MMMEVIPRRDGDGISSNNKGHPRVYEDALFITNVRYSYRTICSARVSVTPATFRW